MEIGVAVLPKFPQDTTDRNRTSPLAFTGNKFEFRMVGSGASISGPNVTLNTSVAEVLSQFADKLENAKHFDAELDNLIAKTFREHKRILFSGNSYSKEWEEEARERGLSCYKTSPEAYEHFTDEKNVELFTSFGVMSEIEMNSRREILFENYRKIKNIEARTMLEMAIRDIIPAVSKYIGELSSALVAKKSALPSASCTCEEDLIEKLSSLLSRTYDAYNALDKAEKQAMAKASDEEAAFFYKNTVEVKMATLRKWVDEMEVLTAREAWPMPTYGDLTYKA
jgi:glutamine synthetase